jgi:hypothetical protein
VVSPDELVDRLLDAPLALAALADHAGLLPRFTLPEAASVPADADERVARSIELIEQQTFGALMAGAVEAGTIRVGPWISEGPDTAAAAYLLADVLGPLAEAVVRRFFDDLVRPVALGAQEWWACALEHRHAPVRLFEDYDDVYDGGEFTWAGLWTVTDPPTEVHGALAMAWELDLLPVSRWRLPVRAGVRTYEIVTPADWQQLVRAYPHAGSTVGSRREHTSWSIAYPNTGRIAGVRRLVGVDGQRATAVSPAGHRQPDWRAVAGDYDGVHLTWAGFLTTEGFVDVDDAGTVSLLRYWLSERTLWLHDVFGEPEPLPEPTFEDLGEPSYGVDVRADLERQARDRHVLTVRLGRG